MAVERHRCPRCEVELAERTLEKAALLACDRCGGIWLDTDACRDIVERAPATASLLFLADQTAARATVQPAESTAACPVYRAPMQRSPVPGLEATIDTCFHGTWFDRRELRIVAEALEPVVQVPAAAPRNVTPINPPRSYGAQFDADHAEMAGDIVDLFLRFLGSLLDDEER